MEHFFNFYFLTNDLNDSKSKIRNYISILNIYKISIEANGKTGILEIRLLLIWFGGPTGRWRPPRACQPGLGPGLPPALGTPLRQWPPAVPDVSDDVSGPPPGHACPPFYACYRDVRYPSRHFVFVAFGPPRNARISASSPLTDMRETAYRGLFFFFFFFVDIFERITHCFIIHGMFCGCLQV